MEKNYKYDVLILYGMGVQSTKVVSHILYLSVSNSQCYE